MIAQVGTLDMKKDTIAVAIIIAKSIDSTLLPNRFRNANRIRRVIGTFMIASAIPNDAIMKNTTGCAKPITAPANTGVTWNTEIIPIVNRQVTGAGSASVINKIRKNSAIPITFLPATVNPSGTGASNVNSKTKLATLKPIFWRFLIIYPL